MVLVGQSGGSFIANSHTQQEEVKQAVYEEEAKEEEDAEEEDEEDEDDMEFTCLKKLSAGERLQLKNATNTAATRSKVLGLLTAAPAAVLQVYSVPAMKLDGLYFKVADSFLLIREEEEPREGMQVVADGLKVLQREME